jgi:hypothetical protein
MGRFFPFRRPQRGKPISTRGLAAGLAGMDEALTGMRVENGQVVWSSNNIPTIVFGDDGCGSFPGQKTRPSENPFGISVSGAVVTIHEKIFYRGGVPLTLAEDTVTIEANGDWVALKVTPAAVAGEDTLEVVRWPAADGVPGDKDGYLYRGLHKFNFADGVATWAKAGWVGGDLSVMGY